MAKKTGLGSVLDSIFDEGIDLTTPESAKFEPCPLQISNRTRANQEKLIPINWASLPFPFLSVGHPAHRRTSY